MLNFFDEAVKKLGINPKKSDDFAVIVLEFLDEGKNYFFLKNLLKNKEIQK